MAHKKTFTRENELLERLASISDYMFKKGGRLPIIHAGFEELECLTNTIYDEAITQRQRHIVNIVDENWFILPVRRQASSCTNFLTKVISSLDSSRDTWLTIPHLVPLI